jgi:RNA polymerase sigma-70 factor (ECF subfamily)
MVKWFLSLNHPAIQPSNHYLFVQIEKLIAGCRRNDRKCQQALYLRFADHAMGLCYRYARDLQEAEDILQNAFVKVFTNIKKYDEKKGDFQGWFSRIVINEALQLLKKNKRIHLTGDDHSFHDGEVEPEIYGLLEAEEIHDLLAQLPDGYRIVFNLYVIEEYSHQEIAELLGISASASRSQLTRAKAMLRQLINQQKKIEHAA